MGAMPFYLAIILARANAYSRASATLHVSGTVTKEHTYSCQYKLQNIIRIKLSDLKSSI